VVSCAGRTRGIIGAQSLINAGVPNRVVSLAGGTQGWRLAGLQLESGATTTLAPVSHDAALAAARRTAAVAARFGIGSIDKSTLAAWRGDAKRRTTYVLEVRTPEEFTAGHLPGSVSAPGGQLVQAIDRWVGVRGARLVLVDDTGSRAVMTAHWLKQMGWDVHVLDRGLEGSAPETGSEALPATGLAPLPAIEAGEAARWLAEGGAAISLQPSAAYRERHAESALWSIRPRLDRLPAGVLKTGRLALFADDEPLAQLAAVDLGELTAAQIALVRGGTEAWVNAGHPVVASPDEPPDADRIDFLLWNHDRHAGNQEAMRAYLRWETELPGQVAADGLTGFRLAAR
jgi:rhodanese-related sulfurtransferase